MNNVYDKFARLKQFTDNVGKVYGTEDFSIYLYSLVKMTRPSSVLELGTGLGSAALWISLALEENGHGICHTVDNGSEWPSLKSPTLLGDFYREDYVDYIQNTIKHFNLGQRLIFHSETLSDLKFEESYDIIFSDYSHGPFNVVKLLAESIPKMNDNSYIFIDSASTLYSSYHTLESIVDYLNRSKIPQTLLELIPPDQIERFYQKMSRSRFDLTHLIENKNRNQNSTAQIKITPVDIMPQPRINIRF